MQKCLGVVEKEAELGGAKARHEEVRIVPGNKATLETDEFSTHRPLCKQV